MAKKKPKAGAAERIRDPKNKQTLVWATFNETEKANIRAAAGIAGKPMSQLVRDAALETAEKILSEFRIAGALFGDGEWTLAGME